MEVDFIVITAKFPLGDILFPREIVFSAFFFYFISCISQIAIYKITKDVVFVQNAALVMKINFLNLDQAR